MHFLFKNKKEKRLHVFKIGPKEFKWAVKVCYIGNEISFCLNSLHFSCVEASVFVSLHYYLYIKKNIYISIYIYMCVCLVCFSQPQQVFSIIKLLLLPTLFLLLYERQDNRNAKRWDHSPCFDDSNVHILDRKERWFERGVRDGGVFSLLIMQHHQIVSQSSIHKQHNDQEGFTNSFVMQMNSNKSLL